MALPFQDDEKREPLDSIPMRELLAAILSPEVVQMKGELVDSAILHVVSREDHDEPLRTILIKLDDFVKSIQDEKAVCSITIVAALELAQMELIARIQTEGLQNDYLDERKN